MAFAIYASVGDTTTQLNDGSPFRLESADELSAAAVLRYQQRGPLQSGATDLGYRLAPRILTLNLLFRATTDALLDGYRSTLMDTFKPLTDVSIVLTVERDDGEVRKLTCYTVDDIAIELVPGDRVGHLHRAIVQLRAANPLWRANAVTQGSASFGALDSWWLAGGAIDAGNVKSHYEYPAQANVNAFAGTITGDWSVVVVTAKDTANIGDIAYVWQDGSGGSASFWRTTAGTVFHIHDSGILEPVAPGWPGTTGSNYHVVESRSGTQYWRYWNNSTLTEHIHTTDGTAIADVSLRGGSNFTWRDSRVGGGLEWTPELRKAAIYGTVTTTQLQALGPYLLDTVPGTVTLVNDGDVDAYPLITLRGPLANPVVVNSTLGGTIDLSGGTIGGGETWSIDLRNGDKRIYDQNGNNLLGAVTATPIDMASFRVGAAPTAAGGTNVFTLTSGSVGGSALFRVEFTNQYLSF